MIAPAGIERLMTERYELEAMSIAGGADVDSFVYRVDKADGRSFLHKVWAKRGFRGARAEEALAADDPAFRSNAVEALKSLFAPGNIVDIAMEGITGPADRMP